MPVTRALFFDVFGTLVDWRGSLLDEAADLGARTGASADWAAVVDDWRRAYQPALRRARGEAQWRDLDALQLETLAEVLRRHDIALPAEDCDELAERLTLSAFSRPFNLLGWAALAIGDLQLVATRDEVVLAAGLAWERG